MDAAGNSKVSSAVFLKNYLALCEIDCFYVIISQWTGDPRTYSKKYRDNGMSTNLYQNTIKKQVGSLCQHFGFFPISGDVTLPVFEMAASKGTVAKVSTLF
jgi:hypothetical protein